METHRNCLRCIRGRHHFVVGYCLLPVYTNRSHLILLQVSAITNLDHAKTRLCHVKYCQRFLTTNLGSENCPNHRKHTNVTGNCHIIVYITVTIYCSQRSRSYCLPTPDHRVTAPKKISKDVRKITLYEVVCSQTYTRSAVRSACM